VALKSELKKARSGLLMIEGRHGACNPRLQNAVFADTMLLPELTKLFFVTA
jgi:hypothetical protein